MCGTFQWCFDCMPLSCSFSATALQLHSFCPAHSDLKFMKKCQAAGFRRVHFLKGIFKNEIYLVSCLQNNFLYVMNHHDMCLENVFCVLYWRQIRVESKPWVSAKYKETITWERWVLLNRLAFSFIGWMLRTSSRPHNIKTQKMCSQGISNFFQWRKLMPLRRDSV